MTLRSDLMGVADLGASLEDAFGLRRRTLSVVVLTRTTGGLAGLVADATADPEDPNTARAVTTITPRPLIKNANPFYQARPGGLVEAGDVFAEVVGSYDRATLDPGGRFVYELDGEPYSLVSLTEPDNEFVWKLQLRPMRPRGAAGG